MASASDKNYLRMDLSDGLKDSIKLNQANAPLLGTDTVKVFEIGTIWSPQEEMRVAYGDKKEIKEMTLEDFCKDMPSDFALKPDTYNLDTKFKMWPLYPFIARDVAVWVPEGIRSEDVAKVIKENAGEMVVRGPELFDEFKKDGKTSYAFRTVFQSYERTLTDTEVNEIMNKITDKLRSNGNWQVR
jgi:phenylalanyl-tRNA synthetase beta subunit